jgi:hypothetical protein
LLRLPPLGADPQPYDATARLKAQSFRQRNQVEAFFNGLRPGGLFLSPARILGARACLSSCDCAEGPARSIEKAVQERMFAHSMPGFALKI